MPHDTELGQNTSTAALRTLGWFVRWMVDAERLVMPNHEPDLVDCTRPQTVPPKGFRLKTSIAGGQQYWPEVWATPALAPERTPVPEAKRSGSAGASVTKYLARYGYTLALNRHGDHWIITDDNVLSLPTFELCWTAAHTNLEEYYYA